MASTKLPARLLDTSAVPALTVSGNLTVDTNTLHVDSSNNRVGIGITNPSERLELGDGSSTNRIKIDSSSKAHYIGYDGSDDALQIASQSFTKFQSGGSFHERMRITDAGRVGIGTTSPDAKLDIFGGNGDQLILDNNGERFTQLYFMSGGGTGGSVWYDSTDDELVLHSTSGNIIAFQTNGSNERMQINTEGTLCINTNVTSDSSSNHDFLRIGTTFGHNQAGSWNMNGYDDFGTLYCDTGGTGVFGKLGQNAAVLGSGMYNYTSASGKPIYFYVDGSYRCMISSSSSGTLGSSDIKWKEDVEDINYGLDAVKSLQPRKFKWKDTGKESIGFIAQEMETIISEVVEDAPGDGAEGQENPGKSLDYAALTSVLTKAIQEQQTIIEDLKSRIETLEG